MPTLQNLSICARVTLDLHNLNSEGTEGNQQQTRMVHIVDAHGKRHSVNAVSGDMFKHIFVEHLTPLLEQAGEPLSAGAAMLNPDRINADDKFVEAVKKESSGSVVQREMLTRCAVTDIAGTLVTEGGKSVARKSCVEFGWVVGLPENTHTEQYFHVKYAPETRAKSAGQEKQGEGSMTDRQAIFHRPANSGIYAFICQLELGRIGLNDLTRQPDVAEESRRKRAQAAIQALMATLIHPSGAQRNTQNPHIVACLGIVATSSTYLPAPAMSPLNDAFVTQVESLKDTLNKMHPDALATYKFTDMAAAAEILRDVSTKV
ncbi:MAG: DevR family CRISPR-associated autoregulator [Bryobacteraceae bacterium]|nr:DevR family CRISPR-associated autoregulator [Bryobacteraceae bacterium]